MSSFLTESLFPKPKLPFHTGSYFDLHAQYQAKSLPPSHDFVNGR